MRINTNVTAINSHRQYGINNSAISRNMERLSSGFRVNRAADDAAGLAISEKMRAQIRGLNQASRNSQDAISLVQTAEGGMQTIQDILQRMRELAVQSANDTNQDSVDREALQLELNQLVSEIDQIADTTEFNQMQLLNGTGGHSTLVRAHTQGTVSASQFTMQAGANFGQTMTISISAMTAAGLGVVVAASEATVSAGGVTNRGTAAVRGSAGPELAPLTSSSVHIGSRGAAQASIAIIERAINCVSMQRAHLGAYQNRLEFKVANLNNQAENVSAAESRIRDADMAHQMTQFTRNNILFQASTAMLAQANSLPQSVLQLLG